MRQLQAAIKYEAGDLRGCRTALEALPPGSAAATAAAGCIAYKEGQYAAAAAQFRVAAQMAGHSPELAYAVAVCQYQQRDYAGGEGGCSVLWRAPSSMPLDPTHGLVSCVNCTCNLCRCSGQPGRYS